MSFRTEKDTLGDVKVPADTYYGAQTARARSNFQISGRTLQPALFRSYVMIKRSAAAANMRTTRLDGKKGHAILKACDEILRGRYMDNFVVDVYQAGAGTSTNMNVNEVIANRATEIMGGRKGEYLVHPNDDVNMAQSTNDTFHSAMHVAASLEMLKLTEAASSVQDALDRKSKEFKNIVKTGRTHLQDAVPITLGQEFSGYASFIKRDLGGLEYANEMLHELNLGGTAVGTGLNAEPKYTRQIYVELNRITKQKFRPVKNMFEATQNFHSVMKASTALKMLALDASKISSDLRLLSMLDEIKMHAAQPGSSIMPGKVNPSIAEMLGMVSSQVVGNDAAITSAYQDAQLELNVFMPVACYNLLDSIEIMTNAINALEKCVSSTRPHREKIRHYLERDLAIVTALSPHIGYEKCAEIAHKSVETGKTIRQVCLDMQLLTEKELDRLLDFNAMTRPGIPKKGK